MAWPTGLRAGAVLASFVGISLTLVSLVYDQTAERIAAAERQVVLDRLAVVLPAEHTNEPIHDAFERPSPVPGGRPLTIYPAYRNGNFVGVGVEVDTPEGYSGRIRLLIGITAAGRVIAVRTVAHRETPGLGDAIEANRSDWIHRLAGRSLDDPPAQEWRLRNDGGQLDSITGATITARAVVDAVRRVMIDFQSNPSVYRAAPPEAPLPADAEHADAEQPTSAPERRDPTTDDRSPSTAPGSDSQPPADREEARP